MALDPQTFETVANIFRNAAFIVLYMFLGGGPGFVVGILICNFIWGRGHPTLTKIHQEGIAIATEHNKQWHPSHPRWQK
jgi:hypothetical protein